MTRDEILDCYPDLNPGHALLAIEAAHGAPCFEMAIISALESYRINQKAAGLPRDSKDRPFAPMDVPGYEELARVLHYAYGQSARGKGKKRHANDKPFHEQPIMHIGKMSGVGGHVYQIMKKAQEAGGMASRGEVEAAQAEFLGAIVYAAAAHLLLQPLVDEPED